MGGRKTHWGALDEAPGRVVECTDGVRKGKDTHFVGRKSEVMKKAVMTAWGECESRGGEQTGRKQISA